MTKSKTQFASRLYCRDDGLEYTGDVYPNRRVAMADIRATLKALKAETGKSFDWHLHAWTDEGFGEIVAGSDI